ncbi:MAG: glutamate-1-semialdehyde 2,1-aminomutase [Acidobacteriota bacterium]|nr:glutamate-1-semialdehyde 2,1-aminomutase [Acidobacteriota bacterium]
MTTSEQLYREAVKYMPAGVNSPVRAFRSVGGQPVFMARGEGAHMEDVDGNRYLDFCGSWGPLILGHRHPKVQEAVEGVVRNGWTFGTPVSLEVDLAKMVVEKLAPLEMVRFVNSGTEAAMSAIRLARGYTGRDHVLKFSGCYHGHVDYLLVEAGSGLATFGTASSAGVPEDFARLTATMPLDDLAGLERLFKENGEQLACAAIEGVPANNGLLIQDRAYVQRLRELCTEYGVMLLFDEVLSGFRMPEVLACEHYGITPDMIALGKVIGGGMPVGAYGGKREVMEHIAPLGNVYQAGTLSGNPAAMAAGLATLQTYYETDVPKQIETLGTHLDKALASLLADVPDLGYVRLGSLFWFYFYAREAPRSAEAIDGRCGEAYARIHAALLSKGIYMAPSAYEVGFLNTAMTTGDLDRFVRALEEVKTEGLFP